MLGAMLGAPAAKSCMSVSRLSPRLYAISVNCAGHDLAGAQLTDYSLGQFWSGGCCLCRLPNIHVGSSETSRAAAAVAPIPAALKLDGLTLAEDTISTLEKFSAALGNPAFSAQDLEPFAAALEDETAALVSLKNQLPTNNPLAALLERVATASYVEATKLRRGDYHA